MRTITATYPRVSLTPRGEIQLQGGALDQSLYLTPRKALSLAKALEAQARMTEAAKRVYGTDQQDAVAAFRDYMQCLLDMMANALGQETLEAPESESDPRTHRNGFKVGESTVCLKALYDYRHQIKWLVYGKRGVLATAEIKILRGDEAASVDMVLAVVSVLEAHDDNTIAATKKPFDPSIMGDM